MAAKKIYLMGALRNPEVPKLANEIRELGFEVFDDWFTPGPEADTFLFEYEKGRGRNYLEALEGFAANHIFAFDLEHLDSADIGLLLMPAGRSCHLEIGYLAGQGKPTYVLLDEEPSRIDIMYKLLTKVFLDKADLLTELCGNGN